jgi:radical SAM superfamily enzyme YgiQ (UPF0313 family)
MIRNVMLIQPPGRCLIGRDGVITERKHCHPPLGLAYLAAGLRDNGYGVTVVDMLAEGYEEERYTEQFVYYGLTTEAALARIAAADPDMIGISILFSNLAAESFRLVEAIKRRFPDKKIVLGGHHPSAMPAKVMERPEVDFVLVGEADSTLLQLCDALNGRTDIDGVKGLFYRREEGAVVDTMATAASALDGGDYRYFFRKDGPNPGDLKKLPKPAWDLFPMQAYWSSEVRAGGGDVQREKYAVMVSTRGCPHVCFYCTSPLMGGYKGYRKRTNEDVIAEIRWLRDEFGVEEIQFLDDNFFVSKPRVKDLCRLLAEHFPDMVFSVPAGTEVNALDEEMIDLLAEANFYRLVLAIESANPEIQADKIDKRVDLSRVPEVIRYIKSRGMEARGYLMIGFPDETRESIEHTASYALSLDLDDFALSVVTPLPGTPVFDEAVQRGLLVDTFNPNDIRYSISSIRIDGMTPEEIEDVRRSTWRKHQKRKQDRRAREPGRKVHRRFDGAGDFSTAGFADKAVVGFSGFSEEQADGAD